jgi:hypothetical protein
MRESFRTVVGSLLVFHLAIFYSVRFVNGIRESIITGRTHDRAMTVGHRSLLLLDWAMCMGGCICFVLVYGGVVFWFSSRLDDLGSAWLLMAVGGYALFAGAGMVVCGIYDARFMFEALAAARRGSGA